MRLDDPTRKPLIADARAAYNDAANRGYVAALYSLATLSDYTDADEEEQARANELLLKAANQEFPLAMYELGRRYSRGAFGLQRDLAEAYRWMSKAAESGSVPAMVETAERLVLRAGRRAKSAQSGRMGATSGELGSDVAKLNLGWYYFGGYKIYNNAANSRPTACCPTKPRLCSGGDAPPPRTIRQRKYNMALMMERGYGLPSPQPEIAERYYRLAAHGGNEDAEIELARRPDCRPHAGQAGERDERSHRSA